MSQRSPTLRQLCYRRLALRVAASLGAAVATAGLLGLSGSLTGNTVPGLIAGAILGALIGWGIVSGAIRPYVFWMLLTAVIFARMGRGCDADPMLASLWGAVFGAFMDWRRWTLLASALFGAAIGESLVGLIMGGLIGWWIAYVLPAQIARLLSKPEIRDRPSYSSLRENPS